MALASVTSFAIDGVQTRRVTVEADVRDGLPAFNIVGLADKSVREARERVRSAITNSGYVFPPKRITVNLAPAFLRKQGPHFDLPLALAILSATEQLPLLRLRHAAVAGELGLDGSLRPITGALAISEGAWQHGMAEIVVPWERSREAALMESLSVIGIRSLQEAVEVLRGSRPVPELPPPDAPVPPDEDYDMADVRGHNGIMFAVEAAVAGGHHLHMQGPPGTGKTMIARRLPSLLPPMQQEEAIEVTKIHSIAGLHVGQGLITERPWRAPHHVISPSALVGGGTTPGPGEITLAHNGVLFLDELAEVNRAALEALRQPLEDGRVTIARGQRVLTFPTRTMLVAASNPCPCGTSGDACQCAAADRARYERRLSGPLLDRIDIGLTVGSPSAEALRGQTGPSSAAIRARVTAARERQAQRLRGTQARCNAHMTPAMLRELADIRDDARRLLFDLHDSEGLSARGHHRVLRVARTVADLRDDAEVGPPHISAALTLRNHGPQRSVKAAA